MPTLKPGELSNNNEIQYAGNLDDTVEHRPKRKPKKSEGYVFDDQAQPQDPILVLEQEPTPRDVEKEEVRMEFRTHSKPNPFAENLEMNVIQNNQIQASEIRIDLVEDNPDIEDPEEQDHFDDSPEVQISN